VALFVRGPQGVLEQRACPGDHIVGRGSTLVQVHIGRPSARAHLCEQGKRGRGVRVCALVRVHPHAHLPVAGLDGVGACAVWPELGGRAAICQQSYAMSGYNMCGSQHLLHSCAMQPKPMSP